MNGHAAALAGSEAAPKRVSLSSLSRAYLAVGATAFGGPAILHRLRSMAAEKGWLTEEEVAEGFAMVQLYPGPIGLDFVAYVGYRLRGVPGSLVAAASFLTPSFLLMLALSALYFTFGGLSWVPLLFAGLEALVVGILVNLLLELAGRAMKTSRQALIALGAFSALLFGVNAVAIVLAALAAGALFLAGEETGKPIESHESGAGVGRWLAIGAVCAAVVGTAAFCALSVTTMGEMGLVFFKIGSVAFGNATTILPLIQADVVDARHWLTPNQFADGIAMGQITPGPFLITATFVGYKVAGLAGAALATFAIFSPSVAMTLVFTELMAKLRNLSFVRGALAGVMASFMGLLTVMILKLGEIALTTPLAFCFAAGSFVAVRNFRVNPALVFAAGLILWAALAG